MSPKRPPPETIGELLFWSYANLAMAHSAVEEGLERYGPLNFIIRARLFKGLCSGTMKVGTILDDERLKIKLPQACSYCGSADNLTIDHLIPKKRGGPDAGDNSVWACRSCNSSKSGRDLLEWMESQGRFPPLMLLRRYLKLAIEYAQRTELLETRLEDAPETPMALHAVPSDYPAPDELVLWVHPNPS